MGRLTVWVSGVFLATGGFLFGYDSGIIASTIAQPNFVSYFGEPDATTQGGIVSAFQGGAVFGTMVNMALAHRMGRKRTIMFGSAVSLLGSALQAGAVNMPMLIVGRFIGGMAVGQLTSTIPLYAAELSEPKYRGLLSGLLQFLLSWGFLVAQWLGYGFNFTNGLIQWRMPLAVQCLPAIILIIGIFWLCESPRWLVERDRIEEAHEVLKKLRPHDTAEEQDTVTLEVKEIRDVVVADRVHGQTSWKTILLKPSWRKRLLLGCGVQAFSPLSGINVINYFGPQIYEILGITTQTSLMIIGISGALSVVYCAIMLGLVDKIGRIKPLIVSAAGLAGALLANAVMAQYLDGASGSQLRAMVAMNFVFSLFFTPLGVISWVYPAEIFNVEVRALGNAITTMTNWIVNLVFAQFSPTALENIGFRYFYVFFVLNLVAMLCYIFFYPETKGLTLEQIDVAFGDQLVAHALQDPEAAKAAEKEMGVDAVERV